MLTMPNKKHTRHTHSWTWHELIIQFMLIYLLIYYQTEICSMYMMYMTTHTTTHHTRSHIITLGTCWLSRERKARSKASFVFFFCFWVFSRGISYSSALVAGLFSYIRSSQLNSQSPLNLHFNNECKLAWNTCASLPACLTDWLTVSRSMLTVWQSKVKLYLNDTQMCACDSLGYCDRYADASI